MERFFQLKHLTQDQLHDLYREAVGVGTLLIEYDKPDESDHYDVCLPEDDILRNIRSGDDNYIVFHKDDTDYPDAITVAFPMAEHPFTTVYIDLDNSRLDKFATKFTLAEWSQMEGDVLQVYPFADFHTTPAYSSISSGVFSRRHKHNKVCLCSLYLSKTLEYVRQRGFVRADLRVKIFGKRALSPMRGLFLLTARHSPPSGLCSRSFDRLTGKIRPSSSLR